MQIATYWPIVFLTFMWSVDDCSLKDLLYYYGGSSLTLSVLENTKFQMGNAKQIKR